MNSSLTIYKASAGSGKTFTLAVRYITLVVKNPDAYKNILAVTFTNKATAEMKERITQHLYGIAHSLADSEQYFNAVKKNISSSISDNDIRSNALQALNNILADYSNFRIETIDKFFQRILHGLARELQQGQGLQLELETRPIIENAIKELIDNIEPGSPQLEWIIEYINNSIDEDNTSLKLSDSLLDFANDNLFLEEFQEKGKKLNLYLQNIDKLKKLTEKISGKIRDIKKNISDATKKLTDTLSQQNLYQDDMTNGLGTLIKNCRNADFKNLDTGKTNISNAYNDKQKLFTLKFLKSNTAIDLDSIHSDFRAMVDTVNNSIKDYNSAILSKQYLYQLNLLASIRQQIDKDNIRLNRFIMADTCALLSQMEQGDTSFVFEKTGSTISHIMIDESQDTSCLQWRNLNIILLETLSQGKESLIVGDVKQAIYRWRNGDWQFLNSKLKEIFKAFSPAVENLDTNYRSKQNIVEFNSRIFRSAADIVNNHYRSLFGTDYSDLLLAYNGVESQKAKDSSGQGHVDIQLFFSDYIENHTNAVLSTIKDYLNAGLKPKDITLLFRNKKEIQEISQILKMDSEIGQYPIVSDEAFLLESSVSLQILINLLRYIISCDQDNIALEAVKFNYRSLFNKDIPQIETAELCRLPLYELAQKLCALFSLDNIEGQHPYLETFFDYLSSYLSKGNPSIASFLDYWEQTLKVKSIPSASSDGITLMTIHKAKGLEFNTVIIPFADWDLIVSPRLARNMWCTPPAECTPYNELPLVPIKFTSNAENSIYHTDYQNEYGLQLVDNLNLLYVALTRPKCNLSILGNYDIKATDADKDFTVKSIAQLIGKSVEMTKQEDRYYYSNGNICNAVKEESVNTVNPLRYTPQPITSGSIFNPQFPDFKESVAASKFIDTLGQENDGSAELQNRYIQTGQLLHTVFSQINTKDQAVQAIDKLVRQGVIESGSERSRIEKLVQKALSNPQVQEWFDGNYRLINESTILFNQDGKSTARRPDRIMIKDDSTIVVDFKFGKYNIEYEHQVEEYMSLLRAMNMPDVSGYLWFVYTDQIVKVELNK
ncbi:MAG: UvrD-helicase domain-containing protein [Bacteroidaceae bacterium]|nr:UvrD-helicase domain-containing protein [Bacteroidaceae bacterium]